MRIGRAVFGTAICCVLLVAVASQAASLPDRPIADVRAGSVGSCDYLEGPDSCDELKARGEPFLPAADPNAKLGIRMIWAIGDRGTTIILRFELVSEDEGLLKASEVTSGGYVITDGMARLGREQITRLLISEANADIWHLPLKGRPVPGTTTLPSGIETVSICYSWVSIAEIRHDKRTAVNRNCPSESREQRAFGFARGLIREAQVHFPDIGSSPPWEDLLR